MNTAGRPVARAASANRRTPFSFSNLPMKTKFPLLPVAAGPASTHSRGFLTTVTGTVAGRWGRSTLRLNSETPT